MPSGVLLSLFKKKMRGDESLSQCIVILKLSMPSSSVCNLYDLPVWVFKCLSQSLHHK